MRGSAWPVFGVVVLTVLVLLAFGLALGIVLLPLDDALRSFLQSAVGNSLAAPFAAVAWTLTYFRLRELEAPRMRRRAAVALAVAALAVLVLGAAGCGGDDGDEAGGASAPAGATAAAGTVTNFDGATCSGREPSPPADPQTYDSPPPQTIDATTVYRATLETSCGDIVIRLDPRGAPRTVNNFVFLAREGFYDGLTFHRVVRDFVIQGGDPAGDGSGGPGYTFADELPDDGYPAGRRRDGQLRARHERLAVLHRDRRRLVPADLLLAVRPGGGGARRGAHDRGVRRPGRRPRRPVEPGARRARSTSTASRSAES